ncbi:RNA polymerase sigma-70 factor [Chitinophaga sp. SYP-B3965]|nr:RNA polymerase sigma-70 factor [Chitinophaga sp. SYP-B3965]
MQKKGRSGCQPGNCFWLTAVGKGFTSSNPLIPIIFHIFTGINQPKNLPAVQLYNENELLSRIAEGDRNAFKQLYDFYWEDIYYIALSFLKSPEWSQDMIQEIFIKIWQKRASLPAIEQFRSYLFIIARNELISALRQKMRTDGQKDQYEQQLPDQFLAPDQSFAVRELEMQIGQAVQQLPEQQRRIFLMTRNDGLSHDEIAEQLGLARKTVANNITKALNHIRDYLLQHGNDMITIALYVFILIGKKK